MPSRSFLTFLKNQRYPLTVPDLSNAEVRSLIEVLATDTPLDVFPYYDKDTNYQVQDAIRSLPSALPKKSPILSLPCAFIPASTLCTTHKGLNPYIINHVFRLIKREVEDHLDLITIWYPEHPRNLLPRFMGAVQCLRSLRGLWSPNLGHSTPSEVVPPQQNKCEACMISRVITDSEYLKNLSAVLLSRTRERCSYRAPPKLSRIVQEALNHRHGNSLQSIKAISWRISRGLKQARKDATRNKRLHAYGCDRNKCVSRHQRNTTPAEELIDDPYLDPPNSERQPSSQTIHFCMIQETTPPFELPNEAPGENEDEEERKRQDQLINDILNAYKSLTPRIKKTTTKLDPDPDRPIWPVRYKNCSLDVGPHHSSPAEQSDLGYDWDYRTITINQSSPVVDRLIDQIGSLLNEKSEPRRFRTTTNTSPPRSYQRTDYDYSEPESSPAQRRITIISLPGSYCTAEEYSDPKQEWSGFYSDYKSEDEMTEEQRRKSSAAITCSKVMSEAG